ncbi:MAG: dTDP-4-dehydrorhamnose 3,5-epimerase [Bacteroidales bacterium]|nr:dTDP-4-dehydrorhamnose 3,5-epimerase [Bacteroidales bacterium]
MNKIETPIRDLYILEPKVFRDDRGYFAELFNQQKFNDLGFSYQFVQDNQSCSTYGVIRGLHYQLAPYAQTKLVRAVRGKILDVAVDLRKESPTFGKWFGVELSEDNLLQLLIPRGFAHGFSVLSDSAIVHYKCDNFYHPQSERGINFNDPFLNIDWQIPVDKAIVSPKDRMWPTFDKADMNFY